MTANPFRSAVFGGFNRADVAAYLEKSAAEANARIAALESDVDKLTEENHALRAERDAADAALASLRAEAERLRAQAEEFAAVKENLAELELAARRRADEYKAQTRAATDALLNDCRAECAALLASADAACANVASELRGSAETLSRLPAALQALRRELEELGKRED